MNSRWIKLLTAVLLTLNLGGFACAQTSTTSSPGWQTSPKSGSQVVPRISQAVDPTATRATPATKRRRPIARVTSGTGSLPNEAGQVWREYDIRPYTRRKQASDRPEQAIIDWILRETGTEVWFSEPVGLLSANQATVRVYHTPQMQSVVADIIDRFVSSKSETHVFSAQLITLASPNWRVKALPLLRPVTVQTPGVDAWLVSKEDAAMLLSDMRKRIDYREYNSPNLLINNGQSQEIAHVRPRAYARSVRLTGTSWPGYELQMGQVDEGFEVQISPLLSIDQQTIDAVIKIHVDQIEKLVPVSLDIPTTAAPRQRVQIQVPQISSWRLHERFRWPADDVLLISRGVVATPDARRTTIAGITNPFATGPARADALLFIDGKGPTGEATSDATTDARAGNINYRGRY